MEEINYDKIKNADNFPAEQFWPPYLPTFFIASLCNCKYSSETFTIDERETATMQANCKICVFATRDVIVLK